MQLLTVSGPPSSGKTSIIIHIAKEYQALGKKVGVVKYDCISTEDHLLYKEKGIPVLVGLSGTICPDHYYVANLLSSMEWGRQHELDIMILESAGLCNRCSPHIKNAAAICVIDNLMGARTPRKIGPMLKFADVVLITKGDIVSQAEREVFAFYVRQSNPKAMILHVNGITGQGCSELPSVLRLQEADENNLELRFLMPAAVCAYCLGSTDICEENNLGLIKRINIDA